MANAEVIDLEQRVEQVIKDSYLNPNSKYVRKVVTAGIMWQENAPYEEITEKTGICKSSLDQYLKKARQLGLIEGYFGINRQGFRTVLEKRVSQIKSQVDAGITKREEIARNIGISKDYLSDLIHDIPSEYRTKLGARPNHETMMPEIRKAFDSGIVEPVEIAKITGFSDYAVRRHMRMDKDLAPYTIKEIRRIKKIEIIQNALKIMNEKGLNPFDKKDREVVAVRLLYDAGWNYYDIKRATGVTFVADLLRVGFDLGIFDKPNIRRDDSKTKPRYERIKEIELLIDEGIKDKKVLAERLGLSKDHIEELARYLPLTYLSAIEKTGGIKRRSEIDELVKDGYSLKQMADIAGQTKDEIMKYIKRSGQYWGWMRLSINKITREKKRSLIEKLAAEGKNMSAIAKRVASDPKEVRNYLRSIDMYEPWKQLRKEKSMEQSVKYRKEIVKQLANMISSYAYAKAQQKNPAYQKAAEYFFGKKRHGKTEVPFERLLSLFTAYYKAEKSGTVTSARELTAKSGFKHPSDVLRILRRAGLKKSLAEKMVLLNHEKAAISRAYNLMSNSDIAYFVGLSPSTVHQRTARWKLKRDRFLKSVDTEYRFISQIYEAQDAGLTLDQTVELLMDQGKRIFGRPRIGKAEIKMRLEDRRELSSILIEKLRVIFPDRKIRKPYLAD